MKCSFSLNKIHYTTIFFRCKLFFSKCAQNDFRHRQGVRWLSTLSAKTNLWCVAKLSSTNHSATIQTYNHHILQVFVDLGFAPSRKPQKKRVECFDQAGTLYRNRLSLFTDGSFGYKRTERKDTGGFLQSSYPGDSGSRPVRSTNRGERKRRGVREPSSARVLPSLDREHDEPPFSVG